MNQEAENTPYVLKERVAELLDDMKVENIRVIELEDHTMFDAFVLGTCTSARHLKSSAEHVKFETKQAGVLAMGMETSENWVALDLGTVAVHLFLEELRELYDLEGLWEEGRVDVGVMQNYLKGNN